MDIPGQYTNFASKTMLALLSVGSKGVRRQMAATSAHPRAATSESRDSAMSALVHPPGTLPPVTSASPFGEGARAADVARSLAGRTLATSAEPAGDDAAREDAMDCGRRENTSQRPHAQSPIACTGNKEHVSDREGGREIQSPDKCKMETIDADQGILGDIP
jgi:hypothetical protein